MMPARRRWWESLTRALTHDFRSPIDPYLRWLWTPLGSLSGAAVSAMLCGFFLHPQGFVVAAGLGAVVVLGTTWPWISLRGVGGSLAFARERTREGEPVGIDLRLRNRAPWSAWGLSVQPFDAADGVEEAPELAMDRLPGRDEARSSWPFVPPCRGVYPRDRPRVATGFPFGLRHASRTLEVARPLVVWPATFPVGPIPEAAGGRNSEGNAPRDKAGNSGDVLGVRPYRRGDSLRRIHWPQTARHGHLIVCELQSTAVPSLQVVLDADPSVHRGSGPGGSREWAIRVAASFVEGWLGQGAHVELIVPGLGAVARAGSAAARRTAALDALARLPDRPGEGLDELLDRQECRRFAGGLRLVVTTDLALARFRPRREGGTVDRFVVLRASAFEPEGFSGVVGRDQELPVRPWIWVDDPARVAQQVRRSWKEVALAR